MVTCSHGMLLAYSVPDHIRIKRGSKDKHQPQSLINLLVLVCVSLIDVAN